MSEEKPEKSKEPASTLHQYLTVLTGPAADLSKPSLARLGIALGALVEAGLHMVGISNVIE